MLRYQCGRRASRGGTASDVAVRLMRDVLIPEQADHVVDNDNNLSDAIAAFLHLLLAEQT
jgi:ribose 1,5-bisphosphokinase PhnN